MDDWIQLPDCQPEHIQGAKMFCKMMTGNLNASIDSCPPFQGSERHLLRAQLARIQHSTELCPKGLFEMDEETGEQKYAEEFAIPKTEELKDLGAWGHANALILNAGRCTHFVPPELGEEEREEFVGKLNEEDKTEERFKAVGEDAPVQTQDAWISKVAGDPQVYGSSCYATNVLQSARWPGAVTVSKNGKYCNIYVGDVIKRGDAMFNPCEPPMILEEPEEPEEQPEPQGKEEAPKAEAPAEEAPKEE